MLWEYAVNECDHWHAIGTVNTSAGNQSHRAGTPDIWILAVK